MSRKLLLATGSAAFFPSIPSGTFDVAAAGSFGWGDVESLAYTAHYYNGKTYYAYVKGDGHVAVRAWDHVSLTASAETDLGFIDADLHAAPVILVRDSDKRILVWYSAHNGASLYQRVSTNAEDISAFGSATNIATSLGSGRYTYPQVIQLTGEASDPLYLFVRSESKGAFGASASEWSYSVSTDGGSTWAAKTILWTITNGYSYWLASRTSDTRIDILATNGAHGVSTDSNLYHFYWSSGAWHATGGGTLSSPPFDTSDATRVHDGSSGNEGIVACGAGLDGSNPVAIFRRYVDYEADLRYHWARWNGSAWVDHQVVANGGSSLGGMALDDRDPTYFWLIRYISGQRELTQQHTANSGTSFTETQLTFGSAAPNYLPVPVLASDDQLRVMWGYDDWIGGTDWSSATPRGWGT